MMNRKTVYKTSIFPAPRDVIWRDLEDPKTSAFLASPWVRFVPVEGSEAQTSWAQGRTYRYRVRLAGFLPFGEETKLVTKNDPDHYEIRTQGSHSFVPVWNHTIYLRRVNDANTLYADKVEIFAGWKTPIVYRFADHYYNHQHRQWQTILETPDQRVPDEKEARANSCPVFAHKTAAALCLIGAAGLAAAAIASRKR